MQLTAEIKQSVEKSILCWLATSSPHGEPNVSPKEIFCHYGDQQILVANIASPRTVKNIKSNPKVCISFIDILVQKGFQLKGVAEVIEQGDTRFEKLALPLQKLAGQAFPFSSLTKIKVEAARPIIAPRYLLYPETTEEEQIASARKAYGLNNNGCQ
jgi:predicted pyridoxine 5'-phosphate oxidase superfamily flavin-nucleotide-binding protein